MGKSLLFLVSGLTIITGLVQVNNAKRMETIPEKTISYYQEQQARNLSKSLIDNAIEHMKKDNDWTGTIDINEVANVSDITSNLTSTLTDKTLRTIGNITSTANYSADDNSNVVSTVGTTVSGLLTTYTQSSENIPTDNSVGTWDQYKALFVSATTFQDVEVKTEVLMQRDSFSKYAYMTQSELGADGQEIWFFSGDEIYGPIHTNGTFRMSGDPTFYGLITSPNNWVAHETNPTNPNFYGGSNFNAPEKEAPTNYELEKLVTAADDGGLRFDNDIKVMFSADDELGYVDIITTTVTQEVRCGWFGCWTYNVESEETESYTMNEFNGIISTSGKAEVKGIVKGEITVHAEDDIDIIGDITYYTDPRVDSVTTDILGLVSESDVVVDQNAHRDSGTQDIDIQASIMALNSSFYVENYNNSSGGLKGTINLFGGIVQKNRGPVGTFNANTNQAVSGYSKNYQYDARLKGYIPPAFPRESVFSVVYWKDKVKEVPATITPEKDDSDGTTTTTGQ